MRNFRKSKWAKVISIYLLINVLCTSMPSNSLMALTSGPSQPEFSSFEPVTTTNMVDPFSGNFTYNLPVMEIPGPNGSGYAVSLSYHSGVTPEEEASWVGLGWSLNPGAINRQKRGFADDIKGGDIVYRNKAIPSHTVTAGPMISAEAASYDYSVGADLRYNNYRGFGTSLSASLSFFEGLSTLSYSKDSDGSYGFGASVNPAALVNYKQKRKVRKSKKKMARSTNFLSKIINNALYSVDRAVLSAKQSTNSSQNRSMALGALGKMGSSYLAHTLSDNSYPSAGTNYSGKSWTFRLSAELTPSPAPYGVEGGFMGKYHFIKEEEKTERKFNGFMFSGSSDESTLMDYYVEKENPYKKRDNFLPVPFLNKDLYLVSGEGVSGGFQLHSKKVGHMNPVRSYGSTELYEGSIEVQAGGSNGPGGGVLMGESYTEMNDWKEGNVSNYQYGDETSMFFRFNGDKAGNVTHFKEENYLSGGKFSVFAPLNGDKHPIVSKVRNISETPASSSFIGRNTIAKLNQKVQHKYNSGEDIHYKAYDRAVPALKHMEVSQMDENDPLWNSVGELSVVNSTGQQYNYGLPVYSAMEKSLSYAVGGIEPEHKSKVYSDISDEGKIKTIQGQTVDNPYASTYLLTSITNPDYVDRHFDGPTPDDFGAWTKFSYTRAYGSQNKTAPSNLAKGSQAKDDWYENNNWYHWRSPYNGLRFNRAAKVITKDDLGSFQSGYKEVYYLNKIETKTHVAYFVTDKTNISIPVQDQTDDLILKGSARIDPSKARKDSKAADDNETAADNPDASSNKGKEKLERIILYAKNKNGEIIGKPLKTVHLEHSQHLCPNTPNSEGGVGKLTLNKVWYEYEGVKNSRIRPYEFSYEYENYSSEIRLQYPQYNDSNDPNDVLRYGEALAMDETKQNPSYSYFNSDGWGNYRYKGADRFDKEQPWIDQSGQYKPNIDYDPAAWNLKQIKLPSGGEIHVQYEEHDYSSVQDQNTMALVSLMDQNGNNGNSGEDRKYYLNTEDLGASIDSYKYHQFLKESLEGEKVYFRFLYRLLGAFGGADIDKCHSDYVTGFANVAEVGRDVTGRIYLRLEGDDYPVDICNELVKKNYNGLRLTANCLEDTDDWQVGDVAEGVGTAVSFIQKFVDAALPGDQDPKCKSMDLSHSYFKIPVWEKKGGGVRVKRLLMYDKGLSTGNEVIYGSEYIYENEDGYSSGVATNEPTALREENPLIHHLEKRDEKNGLKKLIGGDDMQQFEGPHGESVLPSASIGYERVIVQGLHKGKTSSGFAEYRYFTAREFPTLFLPTKIDKKSAYFPQTPTSIYRYGRDESWASQGYLVVKNDMHGKEKSTKTFRGSYSEYNSSLAPATSIENEYYLPGEKVPVMLDNGEYEMRFVGREEEVAMEARYGENISDVISGQYDPDATIPTPLVLFYVTALPYMGHQTTKFHRHVTSTIVNLTSSLKKTEAKQDGVVSSTENLAFDSNTGLPLVTRTNDGYHDVVINSSLRNGSYTSYNVPAAKVYKHMGQKSKNEGFTLNAEFKLYDDCVGERPEWLGDDQECRIRKSFITLQDNSHIDDGPTAFLFASENGPYVNTKRQLIVDAINAGKIVEGDLIKLSNNTNEALYYINEIDINKRHRIYLRPLSFVANQWLEDQNIPTFNHLEVIRSGYTNQLSSSAASVTTYGQTDKQQVFTSNSSGETKLKGDVNGVVSASVTTYSDDWYNFNLTRYYQEVDYDCKSPKTMEVGSRGKWRPKSTYVYKTSLDNGLTDKKIFEAGVYSDFSEFKFFESENSVGSYAPTNYKEQGILWSNNKSSTGEFVNEPENPTWQKLNTVTMYSPHGEALEEQNILGIKSMAKFGYNENLPVLIATNAPYYSTYFNSFDDKENEYVTKEKSHSGYKSAKIAGKTEIEFGEIEAVKDQKEKPHINVKCWVHATDVQLDNILTELTFKLKHLENGELDEVVLTPSVVARVGDWVLLEVDQKTDLKVENNTSENFQSRGPGYLYSLVISNNGADVIYVDDVRMQPAEAEMTAYVYDPNNLRLLTSFDSQHFGLMYQYNAEGKLIRKLIETERGIKTVTETQYNTSQTPRN